MIWPRSPRLQICSLAEEGQILPPVLRCYQVHIILIKANSEKSGCQPPLGDSFVHGNEEPDPVRTQ